jgi:hypothetical protein
MQRIATEGECSITEGKAHSVCQKWGKNQKGKTNGTREIS